MHIGSFLYFCVMALHCTTVTSCRFYIVFYLFICFSYPRCNNNNNKKKKKKKKKKNKALYFVLLQTEKSVCQEVQNWCHLCQS